MSVKSDDSAKVVISAVFGNGVVTLAKFIGWLMSGSPSMLAEGIHSLADTFNQILLFVGIKHGAIKPSRAYPRGHGQSRYLWNLISAIGIFFVGFGITAYHGFHSLFNPKPVSNHLDYLAIGILIFSLVIESIPLVMAFKSVNRSRGSTDFFQFLKTSDNPTTIGVLLEDAIAVLGVLFALIGVGLSYKLKSPVPDSIMSILIAILLGVMAVVLAYLNGRFLIGQAVPRAREDEIRQFISKMSCVEKVVKLDTEILAPGRCHLNLEIELHGGVIIPRTEIERDVALIKSGAEPAPILVDTAERMVRTVGNVINTIEQEIRLEFKEVVSIALEVN